MIDVSNGVPGLNAPDPTSYEEFWPYYLSQHLHPITERVHAGATTAALLTGLAGFIRRSPRTVALSPLVAYGPAFASHFIWEKNRPVTLQGNPFWAARADFELLFKVFAGKIDDDVAAVRAGLAAGNEERPPSRLRASA